SRTVFRAPPVSLSSPTRRSSDLFRPQHFGLGRSQRGLGLIERLLADGSVLDQLRGAALVALGLIAERLGRRDGREGLLQFRLQVDRKSTRLHSSHVKSSYAGFCL